MLDSAICRVDNELFAELQQTFQQRKDNDDSVDTRISRVIKQLQQRFNLNPLGGENLVLYGRPRDECMDERFIGGLTAIAPGLVLVLHGCLHEANILSGLLQRGKIGEAHLFSLRSFAPTHISTSLYIYPRTFPQRSGFKICPVYVSWLIGSGQGESYERLGIDPSRWTTVLEPWLNQWLPVEG